MLIFYGIVFFIMANLYTLAEFSGEYRVAACVVCGILFVFGNIKPCPLDRVRFTRSVRFAGRDKDSGSGASRKEEASGIRATLRGKKIPSRRLRICMQGSDLLLLFCFSTAASALYLLLEIGQLWQGEAKVWLLHLLNVFLVEAVVFWNGIIRVYLTSKQLAVKWRVLGLICGFIPVSYTHLTMPTKRTRCRSRWTPYQ